MSKNEYAFVHGHVMPTSSQYHKQKHAVSGFNGALQSKTQQNYVD